VEFYSQNIQQLRIKLNTKDSEETGEVTDDDNLNFSQDSFDAIENLFGGNEPLEVVPSDLNNSVALEDLDKA
jgi:hypothetical protein